MKKSGLFVIYWFFVFGSCVLILFSSHSSQESSPALSPQTEECIDCHQMVTPGIVEDWRSGAHAHIIPAEALKKSPLSRKVSNPMVPDNLLNFAVGCFECHSLNADKHLDNFEHFDHKINVIVSPDDCATCHPVEKEQYSHSKKAHALDNLRKNPLYLKLVNTITGIKEIKNQEIIPYDPTDFAIKESCYACHGTQIEVKGKVSRESDVGEVEVPKLINWPNQGVGRINPDGSQGACTACHPRHSFSIEIARKPETCSQCHLEPDVPAWNVYRESKHGNIYYSQQAKWNWENIPWTVGKDFKAPTCAVCHNSLIVDPEGEIIIERSHDFGARLWVRIFGLIYSHPQPQDGRTYLIQNQDKMPLPSRFTSEPADKFLIDRTTQNNRRSLMTKICTSCHSSSWAENYFVKFQKINAEADKMVLAATELMLNAWTNGKADGSNPFDELLEQKWIEQWLFNANCLRYAAAMSGPDFAGFKYGWWKLTKTLQEIKFFMDLH